MNKKNISLFVAAVCMVVVLVCITLFGKELDLNSDEVKELYQYLGEVDYTHCGGLITYRDKPVKKEDLSEENRLCMAYYVLEEHEKQENNVSFTEKKNGIKVCKVGENTTFAAEDENCSYTQFDSKSLIDAYQKIYGSVIKSDQSFFISETEACYKEGEVYYCGASETFTYQLGPEVVIYRLLDSAEEKINHDIVIRDYFIKISDNICYNKNNNDEDKECTKALESRNGKEIDVDFIKKYGSIYEHTFKINSKGDHSWYQSKLK